MGVTAAVLVLSTWSAEARAADVFVGPPPFNPVPGQLFAIEILVNAGAQTLGSYSATFQYDKAVVNIVSIAGGTTPAFSAAPITSPPTFSSGATPLAGVFSGTTAPSGFVSVATVTLRAVGHLGQSSVLTLSGTSLFSGSGSTLPATVFGSSVLIGSATPVPVLPGAWWLVLTAALACIIWSRAQLATREDWNASRRWGDR